MNSTVLRVLAILLAIGAVAIGYLGYKASQTPAKPEPAVVEQVQPKGEEVVFAARDIPAGQVIAEADLTTAVVPTRPVRSFASAAELTGRKTRVDIAAGEMLLGSHFPTYSQLALALRPGERALAVKVDEVIGAGGFIEPGDHVDVLLYLRSDREVGNDSSAQVVLSDVRVLAFGNMLSLPEQSVDEEDARSSGKDQAKAKDGASKPASTRQKKDVEPTGKKSKTAVLAIGETDTSTLMLAESGGRIRLALRGPEESVSPVDEEALLQAGLSIPQPEAALDERYQVLLKDLVRRGRHGEYEEMGKTYESEAKADIVIHRGNTQRGYSTQTLSYPP
ncbi:Flp pilus assembly protein CpaB [Methylotuvimicrobium buryatense]|uniref:Flp pilus assembly protein CpaB n=1 Tax=Methylotuvimicrobium buryatense TaxID=95641 RepID=A0A4P9USR0_METBY|nr:Flp pilus assembly protein CpaB [Methylotuvimicrobium buryatense]QCW83580.1 Flp pilus assembly protein CpaB [Methylotuvimicrobium buryatense]